MLNDLRIATVVCRCPVGQLKHNLEQTRYWTVQARKQRAKLVCFPEMNLTGYSNREVGSRHALTAQGPEIEALTRLAIDQEMVLLVGFAEWGANGRRYASHMVITPEGRSGTYRKLHLAPPEARRFVAGESLPVFVWSTLRFGIQLCYDAHFPELSAQMAVAGANVIFFPHASPRGRAVDKHRSWMRHLPARAFDNGLFVVACNQSGDNEDGLSFPGNAVVFSPSGDVIAAHLSGNAGMLVVNLTTDQIDRVRKHRMRYFLPHRRPEIYRSGPVLTNLNE